MEKPKEFLDDKYSIYLVDNTIWTDFAKELNKKGFKWSGHSKINETIERNGGLKPIYAKGMPFIINIYDFDAKLIYYQDINLYRDEDVSKIKNCINVNIDEYLSVPYRFIRR